MKKKILIGSLLVFTLLLLMPSIPAVQQKTIEDKAYSDFVEQPDDDIKYPILYKLIFNFLLIRYIRSSILFLISSYYDYYTMETVIVYPIIYQRAYVLRLNTNLVKDFFQDISDAYGFGWIFPFQDWK